MLSCIPSKEIDHPYLYEKKRHFFKIIPTDEIVSSKNMWCIYGWPLLGELSSNTIHVYVKMQNFFPFRRPTGTYGVTSHLLRATLLLSSVRDFGFLWPMVTNRKKRMECGTHKDVTGICNLTYWVYRRRNSTMGPLPRTQVVFSENSWGKKKDSILQNVKVMHACHILDPFVCKMQLKSCRYHNKNTLMFFRNEFQKISMKDRLISCTVLQIWTMFQSWLTNPLTPK